MLSPCLYDWGCCLKDLSGILFLIDIFQAVMAITTIAAWHLRPKMFPKIAAHATVKHLLFCACLEGLLGNCIKMLPTLINFRFASEAFYVSAYQKVSNARVLCSSFCLFLHVRVIYIYIYIYILV